MLFVSKRQSSDMFYLCRTQLHVFVQEGTKITFPQEGDQRPNTIPADIVFTIKDLPHGIFKRDGSNVVVRKKITLKEVSC